MKPQSETHRNIEWSDLIAEGENPKGFTAQTVNGTAIDKGSGWNRQYEYQMPQVERSGLWGEADINIDGTLMPGKQSNRTGE